MGGAPIEDVVQPLLPKRPEWHEDTYSEVFANIPLTPKSMSKSDVAVATTSATASADLLANMPLTPKSMTKPGVAAATTSAAASADPLAAASRKRKLAFDS